MSAAYTEMYIYRSICTLCNSVLSSIMVFMREIKEKELIIINIDRLNAIIMCNTTGWVLQCLFGKKYEM